MNPTGCTQTGTHTHIGFDRLPRLPFLPMTGVPKCSGLVRGSLSSVCGGDEQQQCASVPSCQTMHWQKDYLIQHEEFHQVQTVKPPNTKETVHIWQACTSSLFSGSKHTHRDTHKDHRPWKRNVSTRFYGMMQVKADICFQDGRILASLSAKWRAPFRQREERLRVFSSPSSNTAEKRDLPLNRCMCTLKPGSKMSACFMIC